MYNGQAEKYVAAVFAFGAPTTINAGLTRYLAALGGAVTTTELAVVVPRDGTLKNLFWSSEASGLTGSNNRLTVYVNGVATALAASWNGNLTSGSNATNNVAVSAGQRLAIRVQLAGGGTTITRLRVSLELEVEDAYPNPWDYDPASKIISYGAGNVVVNGEIRSNTGFKFPDGSVQLFAAAAGPAGPQGVPGPQGPPGAPGSGAIPQGYSILGNTPTPPAGFSFTGFSITPSSPFTSRWVSKATMPTSRMSFAIGVVNDKIYAIGGGTPPPPGEFLGQTVAVNEEFDPAANLWTTKANMPTPRSVPAIGVVNNKIYVIGGQDASFGPTTLNEEYDPATNTWATKASMPTPRRSHSIGVVNGKIYAIGGNTPITHCNLVEEYNPATDTWTSKANMPTARSSLSIGVVNGKIYAVGGEGTSPGLLSVNEEYDPLTDTWSGKASIPTSRCYGAIAVFNNKIYVVSGITTLPDRLGDTAITEAYDPVSDSWIAAINMTSARVGHHVCIINGWLYAVGGSVIMQYQNLHEAVSCQYLDEAVFPPKFYLHVKD